MDNNQLIFSGDCAINFDDLGQFRDFTEDIQAMVQNLKQIKQDQKTQFKQELFRQILKADPQDTFHAPAFKGLINLTLQILDQRKEYFKDKPQIYKLVFHNLLEILQDSFVSYQFSEETGPRICAYLVGQGKRQSLSFFEKMSTLLCLAKLSKKLSYIDDLQNFVEIIFYCINEQAIVVQNDVTEEWRKMMLHVYSEVIQLSTRNRRVRQLLYKKIIQQTLDHHLFLGYKIYLWHKDQQKAHLYLKRMEAQLSPNLQVFKTVAKKST